MVVVLVNATDYWSFHWIIQIILSAFSTDYMSKFCAGPSVSFFCHANAKLAPEHWTIFVIKNIANSRF